MKPPTSLGLGAAVVVDESGDIEVFSSPGNAFSRDVVTGPPLAVKADYKATDIFRWDGKSAISIADAFFVESVSASRVPPSRESGNPPAR